MTCSECQLQIFDGELGRDAEVHLKECEDCRTLDQEARLNASAMVSMREDVIPVRRARRWPWLVAAAAVVVAAIGFSRLPEPNVAPVEVAVFLPEAIAPPLPIPLPDKPASARPRPARPALPAEPLLVKFLTDDPDIVIYWLIDPVQGEQTL